MRGDRLSFSIPSTILIRGAIPVSGSASRNRLSFGEKNRVSLMNISSYLWDAIEETRFLSG
ncbi:hypothetical protein AM228_03855 [Planktothricoides sp. SR001]|nr:hypothetical protein AM228_03855 [Planktothricoides sp. SR001]